MRPSPLPKEPIIICNRCYILSGYEFTLWNEKSRRLRLCNQCQARVNVPLALTKENDMGLKTYRRRISTDIKAARWYPPADSRHTPGLGVSSQGPDSEGREGRCGCLIMGNPHGGDPHIHPDGGSLCISVEPGDWITTDSEGHKSVYKSAEFHELFFRI